MTMKKVYDYDYNGYYIFRIGYVQYLSAHVPLKLHKHENMTEFVYMKRGSQKYRASNKDYTVNQNEVFFTLPNELHDTGSAPEERSTLYYLIIDLNHLTELKIFLSAEEYRCLDMFSNENAERIFKASANLPEALNSLVKCFDTHDDFYDTRIRNALSQVLVALLTPYESEIQSPLKNVERSIEYIHAHLDETIHVSELPALEHTSLSTYVRNFTLALGLPPGEYILKQKIEKTKSLLTNTDLSITEIAYSYGFSSSQYYATVFKRFCNITPTQYRNFHREI